MNKQKIFLLIPPLPPLVKGGREDLLFLKGAGLGSGDLSFVKGVNPKFSFNI
jgi:hypothetical protein